MSQRPEETLPTPESAAASFAPALGERHAPLRAELDRLASAPPQVLILEGGTADERYAVALWHAARLNCRAEGARPCLTCPVCLQTGAEIHQDLAILDGRLGSIKIETVRELRGILGQAPHGDGVRIIILAEAQALGIEAANALLKSLEEPRPGLCFLLLAPQRERLLPTLVSRGWTLTLPWPLPGETRRDAELAEWEDTLARFLRSGQGFFAKSGAKGALDVALARRLVVLLQKALAACFPDMDPARRSPLSLLLQPLAEPARLHAHELTVQCQASLDAQVNPVLAVEWLAVRLSVLCRAANASRKHHHQEHA